MKQFILSSVIFLVFLFALTIAINFFLLFTGIYKQTVAGAEIYYSINKSKEKRKQKKIILGDSMGSQLFPNTINNSTFTSLACNQAIGMIGHYLLLNNALNAGNHFDTVFMVITPFSFQNNLNQIYTYHYFLKPFYNAEYSPLFTKTVNVQIQKIPYSNFCCYPYILTSNWAPDFASMDDITYTFLSPITIQYLDKIKELGFKYNFKLIILPTPTALCKKLLVEKMDKNEIVKNNLSDEFKNYFKNLIYLNDSNFIDGIHLKEPQKHKEYYKNIIRGW